MDNSKTGGIGFVGLLQIVLIVLKLCDVITWSWWWVMSPILISAGIFLVVFVVAILIAYYQEHKIY